MADALQAGGFIWRGTFVWDKTEAARPSKGRFRAQAEFVLWGTKESFAEFVEICLPGVYTKAVNPNKKYHQTGKPTALMESLLRIFASGMTVLDPFIGSGSTLVGAVLRGLEYLGFEINETYADIARRRVRETQPPWFTLEPEQQELGLGEP